MRGEKQTDEHVAKDLVEWPCMPHVERELWFSSRSKNVAKRAQLGRRGSKQIEADFWQLQNHVRSKLIGAALGAVRLT